MIKLWHRRHAPTLASQLPDEPEDVRVVIDLLKELVDAFPAEEPEAKKTTLVVMKDDVC